MIICNPTKNQVTLPKGLNIGRVSKVARNAIGEVSEVSDVMSSIMDELVDDYEIVATIDDKEQVKLHTIGSLQGIKIGNVGRTKTNMLKAMLRDKINCFKENITWNLVNKSRTARLEVLPGTNPQVAAYYRKSPKEHELVDKEIDELYNRGLIENSNGAWTAPVLLVNKSDGSKRVTIDFRKLNLVTVKDMHPLPRIDEILNLLAGAKYFSKIDLWILANSIASKR